MITVSTRDAEECGSKEALRSLLESAKSDAYREAGLGVFDGVLLSDFNIETGEMRYKVIPLTDFYAVPDA